VKRTLCKICAIFAELLFQVSNWQWLTFFCVCFENFVCNRVLIKKKISRQSTGNAWYLLQGPKALRFTLFKTLFTLKVYFFYIHFPKFRTKWNEGMQWTRFFTNILRHTLVCNFSMLMYGYQTTQKISFLNRQETIRQCCWRCR